MFTSTPKQKQRSLVALAVAAALAAVVFAAASPAKAATSLPYGAVDNISNGVLYYSGSTPTVSGRAVDGVWGGVFSIPVRADVTWYKKSSSICALCAPSVVGQASFTQTANLYRAELVGTTAGPYHGFAIRLTQPSAFSYDSEKVCVTAIGYWGNTSLGCYSVVFQPIV